MEKKYAEVGGRDFDMEIWDTVRGGEGLMSWVLAPPFPLCGLLGVVPDFALLC